MESDNFKSSINYFSITNIREKIKVILQEAPLYKSNIIKIPDFNKVIETLGIDTNIPEPELYDLKQYYESIPMLNWIVKSKYGSRGEYYVPEGNRSHRAAFLNIDFPGTLSLFCSECKSTQAFNFVDAFCLTECDLFNLCDPNIQVFSVAYQCQLCKGKPEIFLIRRKNLRITIDGRSPIQNVEVCRDLPKNQKKFIKKAQIAFNSGEVLAALFFQRTFLEQYVREITGDFQTRELEMVFETYKEILPEKFNSVFPSLGNIYSHLSEDLHLANPCEETFVTSKNEINTHFEGLKLFTKQGLIEWDRK